MPGEEQTCGARRLKGGKLCKKCTSDANTCGGCGKATREKLTAQCMKCYCRLHGACAEIEGSECSSCLQSEKMGSPLMKKTECGDNKADFTCLGKNVLFRATGGPSPQELRGASGR